MDWRPFERVTLAAAWQADGEETAWAELYRYLAESRRVPVGAMPRDLHRVTVRLDRVADLSAERARRGTKLPRMRPTRKRSPAFQAVGERLAAEGAHVRGRGIGTRLLGRVDKELARRSIEDLKMAVMVNNEAAQRLYERRGLRPAEVVLYRFGGG